MYDIITRDRESLSLYQICIIFIIFILGVFFFFLVKLVNRNRESWGAGPSYIWWCLMYLLVKIGKKSSPAPSIIYLFLFSHLSRFSPSTKQTHLHSHLFSTKVLFFFLFFLLFFFFFPFLVSPSLINIFLFFTLYLGLTVFFWYRFPVLFVMFWLIVSCKMGNDPWSYVPNECFNGFVIC